MPAPAARVPHIVSAVKIVAFSRRAPPGPHIGAGGHVSRTKSN